MSGDNDTNWKRFYDLATKVFPKNMSAPLDNSHHLLPSQVPPMLPTTVTQQQQQRHTLPYLVNNEYNLVPLNLVSHARDDVPLFHSDASVQRKRKRWESWTINEHGLFLEGLRIYGKGEWKKISRFIQTKTSTQVSSHAQKYFIRQNSQPEQKKRRSIHDMTLLNTNANPLLLHRIDPQNSTPHSHLSIQPFHEMQQIQNTNLANLPEHIGPMDSTRQLEPAIQPCHAIMQQRQ